MKKIKGFTLVELVVVIIVVGILYVVSVPVYKNYVKKACATEAKNLLSAIRTAENVYRSMHGVFVSEGSENNMVSIGKFIEVDASENKYFTSFYVEVQNDNRDQYYAQANGSVGASNLVMGLRVLSNGEVFWEDSWN